MSCSLKSLKGVYIGDHIRDYWDTSEKEQWTNEVETVCSGAT